MPQLMDGTFSEIIVVSETRMISAFRRSLCSSAQAAREGLPISSSPSKMNFTLCFSKPFLSRYSKAFKCMNS